jgi:raffinose/stachyose/melibiose transport system substrate-binding protein
MIGRRGRPRLTTTEMSVDPTTTSRRTFLKFAVGVPLTGAALAACGSDGPTQAGAGGGGGDAGSAGSGTATYWFLSGPPGEAIRQASVKRFNAANPNSKIKATTYQNDAYKTKIKTALGAGQAPTIIWGWGGGGLKTYVEANQVEDLTSWFEQNQDVKNRLFPSSFGAATVNGKIYAMPAETVQPIVLYYNKKVFDQVGVQPPQSWGDIMDLVPKFNAAKIAPFSLGGQSRWTNMMWLEFLFMRQGGSDLFTSVMTQKNGWSDPVAIKSLQMVQDLVKANGFVKGFSSITADSNADQALLYTGKAAMMLHGSWSYGIQVANGGKFVPSAGLGWMNFPPVEGGKGDPDDTVGNPGQYLSISSKATDEQKNIAKNFFKTQILSPAENKEWIDTGQVPIATGTESQLNQSKDKDFLNFVYGIASKAKFFGQSWDQALDPTAAETLLDNISKLFQLAISPQQFADNLNKVTGQ